MKGQPALQIGRLLRLSLTASALADVAAGIVLGSGGWPSGMRFGWALGATFGVYHGGMALNDWADRQVDRETRPERPIPSGAVSAGLALTLALTLLFAGVLCALPLGPAPAAVFGVVALLAVAYDLFGRGPWLGPLLLAACRAGNLSAGLLSGAALAGETLPPAWVWTAPALYGAYVFVVSRLGRLEDGEESREPGRLPSLYLTCAALVLLLVPALPLSSPAFGGALRPFDLGWGLSILLAVLGSSGLLRQALRGNWTRPRILAAMGMCLRRLLLFTATASLLVANGATWFVTLGILAGYPASFALRRVFPPS